MNTESQNELIPTSPGDVLRHKRVQMGLSQEQAALGAKIRLGHLEAIESNETQNIPQVYLNGFIRTYARFLGLPAGSIDKHLPFARGSDPVVQSVFTSALPKNPDDRWFKATSYVLASVVVIALVWQFTTQAVRFSQGEPVNRLSENSSGSEAAQAARPENAEAVQKAQSANTSHLQASIAPLEDVRISRPAIGGSGAESAWSAISQVSETDESAEVLLAGEQSFSISVSADSWVEIVDGNGNKIEMDLLRAGNGRSYVAVAPVKLLLGRASSIELTHNGERVDLAPFTRGNVARITLSDDDQAEDQSGSDQSGSDQSGSDQSDPDAPAGSAVSSDTLASVSRETSTDRPASTDRQTGTARQTSPNSQN